MVPTENRNAVDKVTRDYDGIPVKLDH